MEINEILWILILLFFLGSSMLPALQRELRKRARLGKLHELERNRGSRAITLIHRQEALAFLGVPLLRYMDIDDSEQVLRAIRLTDPEVPIDLILHTPGGLVLAAEQIARALCSHRAPVKVFVPHYAMSGGTLIALAADEVVMDANAVLGPVDPQIRDMPAASILKAVSQKDINELDDETLILADVGRKALRQVRQTIVGIVADRIGKEAARELAEKLASGTWTHDYPITVGEAQEMGLTVKTEVPEHVYELMELYPQSPLRRPSVQYIPAPRREDDSAAVPGNQTWEGQSR